MSCEFFFELLDSTLFVSLIFLNYHNFFEHIMSQIGSNEALMERIASPSASETEGAIYKAVLVSTKRTFTKGVPVFTPTLTITEEELSAKIEEILDLELSDVLLILTGFVFFMVPKVKS